MAERPLYVERGGDPVYRQPYQARDVRHHILFLRGDRQCVDHLFDRCFTQVSGGAVAIRPLTSIVALSLVDIGGIQSIDPPHNAMGAGIHEREVAFWTIGKTATGPRMVLFTPYMFVDSGMAMAAGREVFGFPKHDGVFAVSGDPVSPEVSLDVFSTVSFEPEIPYTLHRLLDVRRVGGSSLARVWNTVTEAAAELTKLLARAEPSDALILLDLLRRMVSGRVPVVFLKQFRDAAQPDRACYQAIVESAIEITQFHRGGLTDDYEVVLNDLASHPVRRDLGLAEGLLRPFLGAFLHYDFRLASGRILWSAQ